MSDDIIIELEHPDRPRRPGDVLQGRVHVRPGAGASSRGLRVRRCWKTHGRGNRDTGNVEERILYEGPIAADGDHVFPFEFEVPPGPCTYRGRLLNVDHYVEAWLDLPLAVDPKTEVEFEVMPGEEPAPPPGDLLERSQKAGKSGVGGCGVLAGIGMVFLGFMLLPVGLILIAVAVFLIVPPVRKAIAEKKLGRIGAALRPELVVPGGEVEVEVTVDPDRDLSVNHVSATLRCREICVSGRGTDRTTHQEEVMSFPVTLEGPSSLRRGERVVFARTVAVPERAPYTFASSNNNVVWDVELHVDIPSWPDWQERVPLVVWPVVEGAAVERAVVEGAEAEAVGVDAVERPAAEGADEVEPAVVEPAVPADAPKAGEPAEPVAPVETPRTPPPAPVLPVRDAPAPAPVPPPSPPPASAGPEEPTALPPDAPELARRLHAILAEPRFGGRRNELIDALIGGEYEFTLRVERNERSFGVPTGYRDGRTLRGTVDGTGLRVEVRFPAGRNEELAELTEGDQVPVRGRAIEWESLEGQPLMEA